MVEVSAQSFTPWTSTLARTFTQTLTVGVRVERRWVSFQLLSHDARISAISAAYVTKFARVAALGLFLLTEGTPGDG